MGKRRKPYNKIKQLNRVADHLLKDTLVCYLDSLKGCVMLDRKRKVLLKPSEAMIAAVGRPHKWSCYIAAFGRTPNDEYMKSEQLLTPAKHYQADLAPIFEDHHLKLMKRIPEHQLCGVGWIASTRGDEICEKEAGQIFERLGAWQ